MEPRRRFKSRCARVYRSRISCVHVNRRVSGRDACVYIRIGGVNQSTGTNQRTSRAGEQPERNETAATARKRK